MEANRDPSVKPSIANLKVDPKLSAADALAASRQVWLIKKQTGERLIQHNNPDGTFKTYKEGDKIEVYDDGYW